LASAALGLCGSACPAVKPYWRPALCDGAWCDDPKSADASWACDAADLRGRERRPFDQRARDALDERPSSRD